MKEANGKIDGYAWAASVEDACGGDEMTYYHVEAPNGEIFCDDFTSGPLEDGIESCKVAIEDHKNGEYD